MVNQKRKMKWNENCKICMQSKESKKIEKKKINIEMQFISIFY